MSKILIIVNRAEFLLSHRYEICLEIIQRGYELHIISPPNSNVVPQFFQDGMHHHPVDFFDDSLMPHKLFSTTYEIIKIIKKINPDLVHSIAMKSVVCGGIATRICNTSSVVSSIAGLGLVFSSGQFKYCVVRKILRYVLSFCFTHNNHVVIMQNDNDKNILKNSGVLSKAKVHLIRGSGVNLDVFKFTPEPNGIPIVLFASRLITEKGLGDLVTAVKILQSQNIKLRLLVAGVPDPMSPNPIPEDVLHDWSQSGLIERLGFQSEMQNLISECNIFCFPSFYGEGVPKVLLEAASCGRPVITTDHPGCRDAINSDTGMLVPINKPHALAMSLKILIEDDLLRLKMGKKARELAEKNYSVHAVVKSHIEIYQSIIKDYK